MRNTNSMTYAHLTREEIEKVLMGHVKAPEGAYLTFVFTSGNVTRAKIAWGTRPEDLEEGFRV